MRPLALLLLLAAPMMGCAGEASSEADDEGARDARESGDALIGGKAASADQFPSTVFLKGGCTAAKVGPRLVLTAAHCALDTATVSPKWKPGDVLGVSRTPADGFDDHVIVAVHVHPDWIAECNRVYCASADAAAKVDAPDVALIELETDVGVPIAVIDPSFLPVGVSVLEVGFGCTQGVSMPDARRAKTLLWSRTQTSAVNHVLHDGSPVAETDLANLSANYAMTDGPGRSKASSGLCPGDSGGPLYRARGGRLSIVGVNSNYTFAPEDSDAKGLPVTNWHTRLDNGSSHHVAIWLKGLGANVR